MLRGKKIDSPTSNAQTNNINFDLLVNLYTLRVIRLILRHSDTTAFETNA